LSDVDIINGDAREWLEYLPDASVHYCVTSPPYFGLRDYGVAGQIGLESSVDDYVQELVSLFRSVRRVLRDDGTLWLNLGDSYAAQRGGTCMPAETLAGGVNGHGEGKTRRGRKSGGPKDFESNRHSNYQPHRNASAIGLKHKDMLGIPWRVAFALQADGWYLRQDIIWAKPNPMPESVKDRCTKSHEYMFLLAKSERYYFDAEAVREDAVCKKLPGRGMTDTRETYGAQNGGNSGLAALRNRLVDQGVTDPKRNRRSVWNVATKAYKGAHFATFPVALIEPCILAGSPEGGTVLDPFGGAGTTGLVAAQHGRRAILIELNEEYAAMARRRIDEA
jgi:DNA modification methylase